MKRRVLIAVLGASCIAFAGASHALDIRPFDEPALTALQKAGQPVAVHFHAGWCPTCVSQSRALDQLRAAGAVKGMTVLVADYDREKELKRQYNVRSQSVLIVFKGGAEVARSAGQTRPEALQQALEKAL